MSRITRTDGSFYANIPSRVILGPNVNNNIKAPINLIGQKFISYGTAQNENYLWLIENFTQNTPPEHIKGQKWYKPSGTTEGELLLTPKKSAEESEWISIPVISRTVAEPLIAESYPGRMIIQNSNKLKILMNNSWRTIPTVATGEQYFNTILPIRYDDSIYDETQDNGTTINVQNPDYNETEQKRIEVYTIGHTANTWTNIARFNEGGDYNEITDRVESGVGSLRYGANYIWEAKVIARKADDINTQKTWRLRGYFSVKNLEDQKADIDGLTPDPLLYMEPDPRIIAESTIFGNDASESLITYVEVQDVGTEDWDVTVYGDVNFPAIADLGTPTDIERFILNGDLYGLMFQGRTQTNENLQWNIAFNIQGIPNSIS